MDTYIAIPIFTDNYLHPLHKKNKLSLLYIKNLNDNKSEILTFNHHDTFKISNINFLKDKCIITPNKKALLSVYPFQKIYDINLLNFYLYNKPLDLEDIHINTIDIFYSRYYDIENINVIIPIYKHLEYCNEVADRLMNVWNKRDAIVWESYEKYNKDAILAFYSIERNGIPIINNAIEIFDKRIKKHISNNMLYSDYFLYTSTGRPSNSFGSVNFAALTENKRKAIIPKNNKLIEFDYDAYHVRLIAKLINYKLPADSAHDYLAKYYGENISYKESKIKTFQYLYGIIPNHVIQLNPFFGKVKDLSSILWDEFNTKGYIETPIFKRRLLSSNLQDMNENKLLNYLLQAYETEQNISTIIKIYQYLYKRKTKLILYTYDSFLFDYNIEDGNEVLENIKKILENNTYPTRTYTGNNYGEMSL